MALALPWGGAALGVWQEKERLAPVKVGSC